MKVLPLNGVPTPANAVILRLGDTPAITQAATIATVLPRRHGHGVWLPCGSNASFNLCANLTSVGGRFFLAWGSVLRIQAIVAECKDLKSAVGHPGEGSNPWPRAAFPCRRWLRICNAEEINVNQFYVVQGDAWGKGFGDGQRALLWAVVPRRKESSQ
jgi:hypothetical protein